MSGPTNFRRLPAGAVYRESWKTIRVTAASLACCAMAAAQSGAWINVTECHVPSACSAPSAITAGPDGALWIAESAGNQIGRITTAGAMTEYSVPNGASEISNIAAGPSDFVSMYQRQGKYALAERYAAQVLAGRRRAFGSNHPDTMASAADLALAYLSEGKVVEGEPLAREALEFHRKRQPDDWQRFRAESLLGASLAGQKKYAEAEPLLLEGYQGIVARKDRVAVPDRYHLDRAREWLIQLYKAWGKPDKAAEWTKRAK